VVFDRSRGEAMLMAVLWYVGKGVNRVSQAFGECGIASSRIPIVFCGGHSACREHDGVVLGKLKWARSCGRVAG
jgi:hypothetical protein